MINGMRNSRCRAFGCVETIFSILLVGGVMVAALHSIGASVTGRKFSDGRARGQFLADSLMTEILAQAYQDEDNAGLLGLETGEADVHRNKFDDVDDYRGHTDSPPKHRDGNAINGFSNWSRIVTVNRADLQAPNTALISESGLKRIKITVKHNNVPVATLVAFKTSTDPAAGKAKKMSGGLEIVSDPPAQVEAGAD